jgi:hypothetical protein
MCGLQNSDVSHNTATGQGSVFNVGNAEMVSFTNVTFEENSGDEGFVHKKLLWAVLPTALALHRLSGARGLKEVPAGTKGSGYCASIIAISNCRWAHNNAQLGGAIYATEGCRLAVANTTFQSNHAQVRCSSVLPEQLLVAGDLQVSMQILSGDRVGCRRTMGAQWWLGTMCRRPLRAVSSWTMAGRSVQSRTSHWCAPLNIPKYKHHKTWCDAECRST